MQSHQINPSSLAVLVIYSAGVFKPSFHREVSQAYDHMGDIYVFYIPVYELSTESTW